MAPYGSHAQGMHVRYLPWPFWLKPRGSEPLLSFTQVRIVDSNELQIVDHAVALFIKILQALSN